MQKTLERIKEIAAELGFEYMGEVEASALHLNPGVRDMCAADKCSVYGKNWMCPPACGSLDYFQSELDKVTRGILVQSVGQLEDSFDIETMQETAENHGERFSEFADRVRELLAESEWKPYFLGAGTCTICPKCAYPDAPCRFPEKAVVSMEAAGLWVSEVCTAAGVPYNHGANTIAYSSCVLI